jgi:hypothetical protein
MTEPAKKLSRTERLLNTRQAGTPVAKQAQSPGKPGKTGSQKSGAPEQSANQSPVARKMGRPSSYNEAVADQICEHVANGGFLTQLKELGLPAHTTIARWMNESEDFRSAFARARETRAETFADQIIEIAETDEDPNRARVRIDARKFIASKLLPRVYGDAQRVEVNTTINVATAHAEALMRLAGQAKQIEAEYKDVTPR